MPRYASGAPVTISTVVTVGGVATDPGGITLQVRYPDLTTMSGVPTPTKDAIGKYHVDLSALALNQLGGYQYAWVTTGTAAGVSTGAFQVVDPFAPAHITYEDAKARLNLSALSDDEVQAMVASAISEQEQWVGAVAPRTVTETTYAHNGKLWLSKPPLLSLTSATSGGSTISVSSWMISSAIGGTVTTSSTTGFSGTSSYVVTYVAGRSPIPQDLIEAALLRVAHSYVTQRGSAGVSRLLGLAADDIAGPESSDFVLMLRAADKERPYLLPPAVA